MLVFVYLCAHLFVLFIYNLASNNQPVTWKSLGLATIIGGLTYAYFATAKQIKELEHEGIEAIAHSKSHMSS